MRRFVIALAALVLLRADMYPDASNAANPAALDNLTKGPAATYYANAPAYGSCVWDATHDIGPCVNAAMVAAAPGGGTVVLPVGTYGLSTKIVWPTTGRGVRLECAAGGGNTTTDTAGTKGSTTLKWIGAAGGRMAEAKVASGKLFGPEMHYCTFNGNAGLAADGLHLENVWHGHFDNLTFGGGFNGGNIVNLTVETADGGGTQNNTLDYLTIDNQYPAGGPYTSTLLRLGAYWNTTAGYMNAALNWARNITLYAGTSSTGLLCVGCDNNHISGRVFGSVNLSIGRAGSVFYPANGNVFGPYFYYTSLTAGGETSFPGCTAAGKCTYANKAMQDATNGAPQPVVEPGADLHMDSSYGNMYNISMQGKAGMTPGLVVATDASIMSACKTNARTYGGANSSLYLCNSVGTPLIHFDPIVGGGDDRFYMNLAGTPGDLNFQFNAATTGRYEFIAPLQLDNGLIAGNYQVGTLGTATKPFQYLYAGGWISSNAAHTFTFGSGLVNGSAPGDAVVKIDGATMLTFGSNLVTTINSMVTPQTTPVAGAGCAPGRITTDVNFIYVCTASGAWKRAALTAY